MSERGMTYHCYKVACGACGFITHDERTFYSHIVDKHHFHPGSDPVLAARMTALGVDYEDAS
jgi:hypothetical protein